VPGAQVQVLNFKSIYPVSPKIAKRQAPLEEFAL